MPVQNGWYHEIMWEKANKNHMNYKHIYHTILMHKTHFHGSIYSRVLGPRWRNDIVTLKGQQKLTNHKACNTGVWPFSTVILMILGTLCYRVICNPITL